jgi:hypothetical protein
MNQCNRSLTHPEDVVELRGHVEALIARPHTSEDLRDGGIALLAVSDSL